LAPKCQGVAACTWLAEREADLLPVGYFHVVFTLPAEGADIAFQNKALLYDLLFKTASETMLTIAADPKHLGARIGITAVLHTWDPAMTDQPHIHMIVPGGGIVPDGDRWIGSGPAFLLPVRVLGALFRLLFQTRLMALHETDKLGLFSHLAHLADRRAFLRHLSPVRKKRGVVYAKPPFAGPEAVLAYLSRYTHRVAIANRRLIAFDEGGVTLRYKDYRRDDSERQRVMTLSTTEFIRRFLLHVLPSGFQRIRHYGLLAASSRKISIAPARQLLGRRATANGRHACRADRRPLTVPVLRRAHGRHRSVRTLPAAPRATRCPGTDPGACDMNRHGLLYGQFALKRWRPRGRRATNAALAASRSSTTARSLAAHCITAVTSQPKSRSCAP
jgi:Putative transposase/Transposase zinc-binding domain